VNIYLRFTGTLLARVNGHALISGSSNPDLVETSGAAELLAFGSVKCEPVERRMNELIFKQTADSIAPPTTASAPQAKEEELQAVRLLAELYELLELYSPQWYTEEHHRQAQLVLSYFRSL